jgi:hypothetical protein
MRQPVLLVDFCVYKPPEELKVNYLEAQDASKQWQVRAHIQQDKHTASGALTMRLIHFNLS